jgi:hypothetical protein
MPEKYGMAVLSGAPLSPGPPAGAALCALAGMVAAKNEKPIDVKAITVVDIMS